MLGKAHITVGIASALTLTMPESVPAALPVIAGAAAGCLICDIDCDSPAEKSDSSRHRVMAMIIAAVALMSDYLYGEGIMDAGGSGPVMSVWQAAALNWPYKVCAGIAGLVLTLTFANVSSHRGFSHSLLAMILEAGFLYLIFPQTALPFAIAFASHIALDLVNKRPVRILYPVKKGFCLGLFYADRLANRICAAAGTAWLVVITIILARVHGY